MVFSNYEQDIDNIESIQDSRLQLTHLNQLQ